MPQQDSGRRRVRRVVAVALIALGFVIAAGAAVLQGAYWVAFLALLITSLGAAYAVRNA
ncbi:MAG TPA: hypothetical protein VGT01_07245 [Candidatus Dormibacteraeota bacterium]|nr:hypothetical protein [Candidatus Dormibacteraeota bacterium]HEV2477366.1 hypothetical protein [Candidatus Dormibacteraeota bacterium]